MLDLRLGEEGRRARHSYAAPHWEELPPHLRGIMVGINLCSIQYLPTSLTFSIFNSVLYLSVFRCLSPYEIGINISLEQSV